MTIRLVCACGHSTSLPDDLAGTKVPCTKCGHTLNLPTAQEDLELMRWHCQCGQRLKARARAAGRTISCPACDRQVTVPAMPVTPAAATGPTEKITDDDDIFEINLDSMVEPPDDLDSDTDADPRGLSDHTVLDEDDSSHHVTATPPR